MQSSIIVATCNRLEEILRFIDSLKIQSYLDFELIIVDSSDNPLIDQLQFSNKLSSITTFKYNYIYCNEKSLTKQRNLGLENSKGEIFYFFDDDIILGKDFLFEMNLIFQKEKKFGGGMGNIFEKKQKSFLYQILLFVYSTFHRFFFLEGGNYSGKFSLTGFPNHPHGKNQFLEVECLSGCCMAYRKEVFRELKFETLFTGYSYMEDCDFSKRVSLKYSLFYNYKAICEHRHGKSGRGTKLENRKQFIFNYSYLFFKNFYKKKTILFIAYFWSLIGLYLEAFVIFIILPKMSLEYIKGYSQGLVKFYREKKNLIYDT